MADSMNGRTIANEIPCTERLSSFFEKRDEGYEADEEESDQYDSDSTTDSSKADKMQLSISMEVLRSRRRRRSRFMPSLAGLLSSIHPQLDEQKSAQFVSLIRSYCEKQADYLQLQRNFIAARCYHDDMSRSTALSTNNSNATHENAGDSNQSDGSDENATSL